MPEVPGQKSIKSAGYPRQAYRHIAAAWQYWPGFIAGMQWYFAARFKFFDYFMLST
jgi:hypothetical protein